MTIHRHCRSGRITSRLSDDGQRLIDLSELIRAYGEPPSDVTPDTPPEPSPRYTSRDTSSSERDDLLLRELRALREQVVQLQEEVRELRRLPAPGQLQEDLERALPAETGPQRAGGQITGFGDLLRRFEAKH
ncbi:hypothetical protein MKP05_20885 [Halomonas sp. EGI 63088]|uniref:Uncharacterized protein n=2 Tax=Pseudomonadati TaxID=3379134 RepID=A0ABS9S0C2_9GAMM|nr:hypothetical protein [Halomonas flagellata]MCH4565558.1 hypothetical protein [Halomonas flagellata]